MGCLAFVHPDKPWTSNALPASFAGLMLYFGIVSFLNGWKRAGIRFGEEGIVATWAGKTRTFRYEEILAISDPGSGSEPSSSFRISSATHSLQFPKILQGQNVESLLKQRMDDCGLSYSNVRPVSRREVGFFFGVVAFVLLAGAYAYFRFRR